MKGKHKLNRNSEIRGKQAFKTQLPDRKINTEFGSLEVDIIIIYILHKKYHHYNCGTPLYNYHYDQTKRKKHTRH